MNSNRLRLAGMVAVCLGIAIACAMAFLNYMNHGREVAAIAAIRSLNAEVAFSGERRMPPWKSERDEPSNWWQVLTGTHKRAKIVCFGHRTAHYGGSTVAMRKSDHVADDDLRHVAVLDSLEVVDLSNTSISVRGLRRLRPLSKLRILALDGSSLDDDAVEEICLHRNLEILDISRTTITDRGEQIIRLRLPGVKLRR
jgi:hypothetical protein